jgi:hypothetical protein
MISIAEPRKKSSRGSRARAVADDLVACPAFTPNLTQKRRRQQPTHHHMFDIATTSPSAKHDAARRLSLRRD